MKAIFTTGGTGYIGKRLIKLLLQRGHRVVTLVRKGSENKIPAGAEIIIGDPFDANTFQQYIPKNAVFIQLLGVSHPSPAKADQFKQIDLRSVKASADAAAIAGVSHFIYMSVSMTPSKLMAAYQSVRSQGEEYCLSKNLDCTFIRPWYVLGPGHWWPVLLLPFYGIAMLVPAWNKKAKAMGLVTISKMINTLVKAVEANPEKIKVYEIGEIKKN
jgi:nucleoside-diphosphate-sugar epimerase